MTNAEKAMADITEQLSLELDVTVDLIHRLGGGVVLEEFPGALQETALDPGASTQLALIDAADALGETLAQLDATAWSAHPLRARQPIW
jgi:hypothetical protein